jgi:antitoxin (DNA-binding transcriptional repressor) of toxin-antitoxin stability system
MATAGARKNFASLVRRTAAGERIKLTRYNKTVAIVIPKQDLAKLEDCEQQTPEDAAPERSTTERRRVAAKSKRAR